MRTFFTLFLACVISCSGFSQNTFRTGIDGFSEYELYDLVQLSNGTYTGLGTSYSSENQQYIGLFQLNAQGKLIQSKILDWGADISDVEGFSLIKTTDGGLAVAGEINYRIALMKFDANLNLEFHKQYQSIEDFNYSSRLLQTSDGGYMIATYGITYLGDNESQVVPSIVKTDAAGVVVWSREYIDLGKGYTTDVVATKDGNYAFVVSTETVDSSYAKLVKINSTGGVIWTKYVATDSDHGISPSALLSAADGSLVVTGVVGQPYLVEESDYDDIDQLFVLKFDQSGNLLWSRRSDNGYNPNDGLFNDIYIWNLTEDRDGGYVMTGEQDFYDSFADTSTSKAYALKVSSTGSLVWTRNFTYPNAEQYFFSVITTSDGGYATSGNVYSYDNDDPSNDYDRGVIYKLDATFNTCGNGSTFGNLVNMQAVTSSQENSPYSYNANINNDSVSVSSVGTEFNFCSILPLQLLSFNATLQNKSVSIEWKTTNEINTDHFTVERSSNRTSFNALQTVSAKGNGSTVQTYMTSDLKPLPGTSYYRLQQVDKDGKTTYSNTVPVIISANGTIAITPNPVRNEIHVLMQSTASSNATINVSDIAGKLLLTKSVAITEGANTITIPAASLSKGLYILTIKDGHSTQSLKFVKE